MTEHNFPPEDRRRRFRALALLEGGFFAFFGLLMLVTTEASLPERILHSLAALSLVVVLPGLHTGLILALSFRRTFSLEEFLTLSTLSSLLVPPFLLTLLSQELGYHPHLIPLGVSGGLALTTLSLFFLRGSPQVFSPELSTRSLGIFLRRALFPGILFLSVALSIVSAYTPLPDLDPYYWLAEIRTHIEQHTLPSFLADSRPLFYSFSILFIETARIDSYAFFKYVLPFSLLALLPPLSLLARHFSLAPARSLLYFFPFISGIVLLFTTEPVPQSLANILLSFIVLLSLHALFHRDTFFFFLSGPVLALGYFIHELFILPLLVFLLTLLVAYRRTLLYFGKRNLLSCLLTFILLLSPLTAIARHSVTLFSKLLESLLHIETNFLFPLQYVNIDGNPMGWGDGIGVLKYYLFYVGPPLLLLFVLTILSRHLRGRILALFRTPPGFFLLVSFGVFFFIAEIFPRFLSLAYLPDRAWIPGGILALPFLVILLRSSLGKYSPILFVLLLGFTANIGAAAYINTLKKYVITEGQLRSAQWIQSSLPPNRILFTLEHETLLRFFSQSQVINIRNPNFFFSESTFTHELSFALAQSDPRSSARASLDRLQSVLVNLQTPSQPNHTLRDISEARKSLDELEKLNVSLMKAPSEYMRYIYYAAPSSKNPYLNRPYLKRIDGNEDQIFFFRHPDRFRLLYEDRPNKIFLWEILPEK